MPPWAVPYTISLPAVKVSDPSSWVEGRRYRSLHRRLPSSLGAENGIALRHRRDCDQGERPCPSDPQGDMSPAPVGHWPASLRRSGRRPASRVHLCLWNGRAGLRKAAFHPFHTGRVAARLPPAGRKTEKVEPAPSVLTTSTRPEERSISCLTMANPRPLPSIPRV